MMYLKPGEFGFDPDFPNVLVPLRPDCGPERIASLTVKRPPSVRDQANWVVWNGALASKDGKVQTGWEDNDKFFKYVKDARNRTWNGDAAVERRITIAEEGRSGLWKQHNPNKNANTTGIIPPHLRFRLPDADEGA